MKARRSFVLLWVVASCTGTMPGQTPGPSEGSDDPPGNGGSTAGGRGGPPGLGGAAGLPAPEDERPGPLPLRRLSNREYENTVRDLFAGVFEPQNPAAAFPSDGLGASGYVTPSAVAPVQLGALLDTAAAVAKQATAALPKLLPCSVGLTTAGEAACARTFVTTFGRRVFRRPLTADEAARLVGLYDRAATELGHSFPDRIRVVLTAMLSSPRFLYHWEHGDAPLTRAQDGSVALGQHHLASRLSYFLWSSMPDETLLAAADEGALARPEAVAAQAERLLADPRARGSMAGFVSQWLHLLELPTLERTDPAWTPALRAAMQEELERFVADVVLDGAGSFATLLAGRYTFANGDLAKLYGVAGGATFGKVALEGAPRAGLLTMPAVLATHFGGSVTSSIYRGLLVRKQLLCDDVPGPPPNVDTSLPQSGPNATVREVLADHTRSPSCATCHKLMDPMGMAFLAFDSVGRWHADERPGLRWDSRAEVSGLDDGATVAVDGPVALAELLAKQTKVRRCFVRQATRYALGRHEEPSDAPLVDALAAHFEANGLDVKRLLVGLATSASFARRAPEAGEVIP